MFSIAKQIYEPLNKVYSLIHVQQYTQWVFCVSVYLNSDNTIKLTHAFLSPAVQVGISPHPVSILVLPSTSLTGKFAVRTLKYVSFSKSYMIRPKKSFFNTMKFEACVILQNKETKDSYENLN